MKTDIRADRQKVRFYREGAAMLRRLYDWTLSLAARPQASRWLAAVSFIESSFFPIPPDVMLMPMCMARREKSFHFAAIATAASVIGGVFGYAIGLFFFATIGQAIIDIYGLQDAFEATRQRFNDSGVWWVMIAGFTPLPFKVITIVSGVTQMPLVPFIIASIIGRSGRFFVVGALFWWFGAPIKTFIERWFNALAVLFVALLVGGFVAVKYLL